MGIREKIKRRIRRRIKRGIRKRIRRRIVGRRKVRRRSRSLLPIVGSLIRCLLLERRKNTAIRGLSRAHQ